jgi:hypothetical protein
VRTDATQREKEAIIRNDARVRSGSTFLDHTHSDDEGGRYAKPTNVIGSAATAQYPKLPPSSPWHDDPVPPEGSLGFEINEVPIVGEAFEVAKGLGDTAATNVADVAASPCGEVVVSSSSIGDAALQHHRAIPRDVAVEPASPLGDVATTAASTAQSQLATSPSILAADDDPLAVPASSSSDVEAHAAIPKPKRRRP